MLCKFAMVLCFLLSALLPGVFQQSSALRSWHHRVFPKQAAPDAVKVPLELSNQYRHAILSGNQT